MSEVVDAYRNKRYSLTYINAFFWFNVLILPFFDNISGFLFKINIIGDGSIGSPSQLGRLIATGFVVYLIFKLCSKSSQRGALCVLIYFTFVEWSVALVHWNLNALLFGLITSSKIVYVSFCLILFSDLAQRRILSLSCFERWMVIYGTVVSIFVLLAYTSGFHIANYSKGIATRGLFISGNGLGVVIGSCALVLIHRMRTFGIIALSHISLLLVTTALIGTKGALAFSLFGVSYLSLKSAARHPMFFIFTACISAYYLVSPLLEILNSVFENIIFKFDNIDNKWALLASSRDVFIIDAFKQVTWSSFYAIRFLTGAGGYFGYLDPLGNVSSMRKLLENDLFELFFCYGFFAVLSYIILYLYGVVKALSYKCFFYVFLFSLIFMHSISVGHVVFNGTSSIMLALIFGAIISQATQFRRKEQCLK